MKLWRINMHFRIKFPLTPAAYKSRISVSTGIRNSKNMSITYWKCAHCRLYIHRQKENRKLCNLYEIYFHNHFLRFESDTLVFVSTMRGMWLYPVCLAFVFVNITFFRYCDGYRYRKSKVSCVAFDISILFALFGQKLFLYTKL